MPVKESKRGMCVHASRHQQTACDAINLDLCDCDYNGGTNKDKRTSQRTIKRYASASQVLLLPITVQNHKCITHWDYL